MKTITFYNERGGIGKSTFTIMYASWLKYKFGINVGVVDLDMRIESYRKKEIAKYQKQQEKTTENGEWPDINSDAINLDNIWPLVTLKQSEISRSYGNVRTRYSRWLQDLCTSGPMKDCEVLLIDLPGAMNDEIRDLFCGEKIGQLVIPFDKDQITVTQTIRVVKTFEMLPGMKMCGVLNMAQSYKGMKEKYELLISKLQNVLPVLPDMISFSDRVKKFNIQDGMRSTLFYPDWEQKCYEGSKDLGLDNLFIDVTKELNKSRDLVDTPKADLSFVNTLKKKDQPSRQLKGTKFPDYEI